MQHVVTCLALRVLTVYCRRVAAGFIRSARNVRLIRGSMPLPSAKLRSSSAKIYHRVRTSTEYEYRLAAGALRPRGAATRAKNVKLALSQLVRRPRPNIHALN